MKIILNESEKERILNQHNQLKNPNPVFDLVLTENNKYLIFMDEVFVNGGDGKSIGTIWENTYIFNEILNESLRSKGVLTEDIEKENNTLTWLKEDVKSWINEQEEDVKKSNWFTDEISKSWNNLKDGKNAVSQAFKGNVLPFFRWVRRMSMTNIGIVVDIIGAILTVKGSVAVWLIIAGLDVYEIATGDYDPQDPDRKSLPYFYLIMDLISAVFTAAAGGVFKASIKTVAKKGVTSPRMAKWLLGIADKLPWLSKQIKSLVNTLVRKFNNPGILKKIISSIDMVFGKLSDFIKRLVNPKTLTSATKTGLKDGAKVVGINKGIEYSLNKSGVGGGIGNAIQSTNDGVSNMVKKITGNQKLGDAKVNPNDLKTFEKFLIKNGIL